MTKAEALIIDNRGGLGKIGISKNAIASLALISLDKIEGVCLKGAPRKKLLRSKKSPALEALLSYPDSIRVVLPRSGGIKIFLKLIIEELGSTVEKCAAVQKRLAEDIALATDGVIPEIKIEVHRRK